MIGFYGEELPADVETFIKENNIGFIILFSRNINTVERTVALNNYIHALCDIAPAIYTDQEGGLVVRFAEMAATVISPMGLTAAGNPRFARYAGKIIGKEMKAVGIDGVFAPVLDVNIEESNPVIGTRSFSDSPELVSMLAKEFVSGLHASGVAACGKHYPGHGSTTRDSHLEIPEALLSPEYFPRYCLSPFSDLARKGIDSLMTAHVRYPQLSSDIATFSPYFIQRLLRERIGYRGVVFTDCLEMKAIKDNFSVDEIVKRCFAAGCDVLCVSHHLDFQEKLLQSLLTHVKKGIISEGRIDESLSRVLKLKKKFGLPGKRRIVNPRRALMRMRSSLEIERSIAERSITLLRNRKKIIPLDKNKACLLLEWQTAKAPTDLADKVACSPLAETARVYLPHLESRILQLGEELPGDLKAKLSDYDYIVACPNSLNREQELKQAKVIQNLIETRADAIVAAIGNPYDIRHFPGLDSYLVTYGSRRVQIEACFRLLTGEIEPSGFLPVEIKDIFPRFYGLGFSPANFL